MNFSVNQARHLYVAKAKQTSISASSTIGDIAVNSDTAKSHMYFSYMGAGGPIRSDLINVKDIINIKAVDADSMATKKKQVAVTLDTDVSSSIVGGQDYILRINFTQYIGISDEMTSQKYGYVRGTAGMTASNFYKEMVASLFRNFSRELCPLVEFIVPVVEGSGDDAETVNYTVASVTSAGVLLDADGDTITPGADGFIIREVEQEWTRGIKEQVPVYFEVIPTTIIVSGEELTWGKTAISYDGIIGNGKKIADLEYFFMGERGDMYRGIGFPNNIPTTYLVDPDSTYSTLEIHYAYVGDNEGPQKSEKTITIVSTSNTVINALVTAINTITSLGVSSLT